MTKGKLLRAMAEWSDDVCLLGENERGVVCDIVGVRATTATDKNDDGDPVGIGLPLIVLDDVRVSSTDILCAGVLTKYPGEIATRVVLRQVRGEYVVHVQGVDEDGRVSYTSGFYTKDFAKAYKAWQDRVGVPTEAGVRAAEKYREHLRNAL